MNLQATAAAAETAAKKTRSFRSVTTGLATLATVAFLSGAAWAQDAAAPAAKQMGPLEFFQAGGFVMWPLLFVSLSAIAVIVERFIAYNLLANTSPGLVASVIQKIRSGDYQGALGLAGQQQGPVADVVTTLVQNRNDGKDILESRAEEVVVAYELRLEKFMWILDSATTLSPLLGLLGTIVGMVRVFQKFQGAASESGKASVLSGVGESLYATASGIFVALICFAFYNYFTSRRRNAVGETEQAATRVLTAIEEAQRKTAPVR